MTMFLDVELVIKLIMNTRTTAAVKCSAKLRINHLDPILTKKQSLGLRIMKVFSGEKIIE